MAHLKPIAILVTRQRISELGGKNRLRARQRGAPHRKVEELEREFLEKRLNPAPSVGLLKEPNGPHYSHFIATGHYDKTTIPKRQDGDPFPHTRPLKQTEACADSQIKGDEGPSPAREGGGWGCKVCVLLVSSEGLCMPEGFGRGDSKEAYQQMCERSMWCSWGVRR